MKPSGRKAVLECLKIAGIQARAFDPVAPSGDEILCVSKITEDVCDFVRNLGHDGERILALQTAPVADSSSVWRLLHAGVSEVLVWSSAEDMAERIRARFERRPPSIRLFTRH